MVLEENLPFKPYENNLLSSEKYAYRNSAHVYEDVFSVKKKEKTFDILSDLCELWHIPQRGLNNIYHSYIEKKSFLNKEGHKFKDEEILAFVLHVYICNEGYGLMLQDIVCILNIENNNFITKLQKALCENSPSVMESLINKICVGLCLNFKNEQTILHICRTLRKNNSRIHPKSYAVLVIIKYCFRFFSYLKLERITKEAGCSKTHICSLMKKEKTFISQLELEIKNL